MLGVSDVLVTAVKSHPRHRGVQDQAQYALLRLLGWRAPVEVLSVPDLQASPEAVSAALWALSRFFVLSIPKRSTVRTSSSSMFLAQVASWCL